MKSSKKGSVRYVLYYLVFALLFSVILLVTMSLIMSIKLGEDTTECADTASLNENECITVVIDAGHGGEDGGAIGTNGALEKDINLDISFKLCDMLRASGVEVIMTRSEDILLYDRNTDYKGRKKILDMAERLKIVKSQKNAIFVSIHMNSFPQSKYRGLQVYYSGNSERSLVLANAIQESVATELQKENTRKVKPSSNIFLLERIEVPAVLIECGFLSNAEECALLCDDEYRKELALCVYRGIFEFISEDNS